MSSRRIIQAITWLVYIIVIGTPLFYWKWSLYPYAAPKTAFFEAAVEIVFALWIALAVADKRYRPRMTPLGWAVAAYLGMLTVTAFTGADTWRSFFSDLERGFGIAAYYHLAALALVLSTMYREIPWKKIWYASFWTSLAVVGLAVIQLKIPDLLLASDAAGGRPGSTFGNPTFLAGYLLFNIFLAGYYLLKRSSQRETFFLGAVVLINIIGIFLTETRGDILGVFGGIFILVVLFAFRPPTLASRVFSKKSFYVLLVVIFLIGGSGIWITRNSAIWSHVPGIDRLKDLTFSGANSDIGPRLMALSASWKGFLDRPLTGWGFENFNIVFNKYYDPKVLEYGYAESNFDKPHDIVMEELDAGGILLLVAYLGMLIFFVREAWKVKDQLVGQVFAALIAAYFIRSLVIFDTIGPAVMLFMVFGWVDGMWREERQAVAVLAKGAAGKAVARVDGTVAGVALAVGLIAAYFLNGTAFAAGTLAWQGHEDVQLLSNPTGGLASFNDLAATWNVYGWDFTRDYANVIAQAYFYNESTIPKSAVQNAIAQMNQVVVDHPNDAYNHYLLTDIYNLASDIDPKNYLAQAELQAQQALVLSPNRQEIYFYLMKTKTLEEDVPGALSLAKQALDLDPKVADAHFYYGMLAFANGDAATGYNEVESAITMGRPWGNFNEPKVAADYFTDSGHVAEAISLYKTAFSMSHGDVDTEIRLGVAEYINKDFFAAKQYLSDARSHIDIRSNSSYSQYAPVLDALGIQ